MSQNDRPSIQLTVRGPVISLLPGDLETLQAFWRAHHYIRLPQFFAPDLVAFAQAGARRGRCVEKNYEASGAELYVESDEAVGTIDFLMNSPEITRLMQAITGVPHVGAFFGRIYRLVPNTGQAHDWHSDMTDDRIIAISVNVTDGLFEGGRLELRDAESLRPLSQYTNIGLGDCVAFRLGDDIEHRVLPVTGTVTRQAFAGWFHSQPDYAAHLRTRSRD